MNIWQKFISKAIGKMVSARCDRFIERLISEFDPDELTIYHMRWMAESLITYHAHHAKLWDDALSLDARAADDALIRAVMLAWEGDEDHLNCIRMVMDMVEYDNSKSYADIQLDTCESQYETIRSAEHDAFGSWTCTAAIQYDLVETISAEASDIIFSVDNKTSSTELHIEETSSASRIIDQLINTIETFHEAKSSIILMTGALWYKLGQLTDPSWIDVLSSRVKIVTPAGSSSLKHRYAFAIADNDKSIATISSEALLTTDEQGELHTSIHVEPHVAAVVKVVFF